MSNTNNNQEWTPASLAIVPTTERALVEASELLRVLTAYSNPSSSASSNTASSISSQDTSIDTSNETSIETANGTANDTSSVILTQPKDTVPPDTWRLILGTELPELVRPDGVKWQIDFRSGKARHRAAENNRSNQPLARALGISKLSPAERLQWHVLDGTAGAGSDGWQLAAAGAYVTLVEQHPILFTMLNHAVHAAKQATPNSVHNHANAEDTASIASRVCVVQGHVEDVIKSQFDQTTAPNAIYLDPMYPTRRSKAAVKKPMQFIQGLVGKGPAPTEMAHHCLAALTHPTLKRVVIKRPSDASELIARKNWHGQLVAIDGGAARFDVYLP